MHHKQKIRMMSVCGVLCSDCPAYLAPSTGIAYQRRVADAWHRIYGLSEARRCCLDKGLSSCAECVEVQCEKLERAQALWDGVPKLASTLSRHDFVTYARPYCGHRRRLAAARVARHHR